MGVIPPDTAACTNAVGNGTCAPFGVSQLVKIGTMPTRPPNRCRNGTAGLAGLEPGTNTPSASAPPPPGPGRCATPLLAAPDGGFEFDDRRTATKPPMDRAATVATATMASVRGRLLGLVGF